VSLKASLSGLVVVGVTGDGVGVGVTGEAVGEVSRGGVALAVLF
jgi:hypothetical protein